MTARTICIGTSPPMLMQALDRALAGDQVTIVERASRPGGAWATPPMVGLDRVEVGVHLLENRPEFYAMLRDLGVRLVPDQPGTARWRRLTIGLALSRPVFHAMVAFNSLLRGQPDKFARIMGTACRGVKYAGVALQYPVDGCAELMSVLLSRLAACGVEPRYGVEIQAIDVSGAGVHCRTSGGALPADRVCIASRAHAPVYVDGERLAVATEAVRTLTLILRGKDPARPRISYVELLRDPHVKRVRDVSRYARPTPGHDEFVLAVQLRDISHKMQTTAALSAMVEHLVTRRLLSPVAVVTHHDLSAYACETITNAGMQMLVDRCGGQVMGLRTTDFADEFRR